MSRYLFPRQIDVGEIVATFAYLDESGDTGFKRLGRGTSDYFVLTMVLLDDPGPLHAAVEALRDELGMARREEFRFAKTAHSRRDRFLDEMRRHDISIRALVVHKALLLGRPESRNQEALCTTLVCNILLRNHEALSSTTVVLDEYVRGRKAQQDFNTVVRRTVNTIADSRRIKEIRHRKSQGDSMIQITDMISGAIYASRARANDHYLSLLTPRIHEIWDWDGQETAMPAEEN